MFEDAHLEAAYEDRFEIPSEHDYDELYDLEYYDQDED